VIRHGGSAVILAIDRSKSKKDPLVLIERQFRTPRNIISMRFRREDEQGEDQLRALSAS